MRCWIMTWNLVKKFSAEWIWWKKTRDNCWKFSESTSIFFTISAKSDGDKSNSWGLIPLTFFPFLWKFVLLEESYASESEDWSIFLLYTELVVLPIALWEERELRFDVRLFKLFLVVVALLFRPSFLKTLSKSSTSLSPSDCQFKLSLFSVSPSLSPSDVPESYCWNFEK